MQEKAKKKLHLTKKQFIIGIVAICGIALVIEAVLLVRMLSKRQEKGNGEENTPTPTESVVTEKKIDSFIRKEYVTSAGGERQLKTIKQEDYDSEGLLVYTYYFRAFTTVALSQRGTSTSEVFYSYDSQKRLTGKERINTQYYSESGVTKETKHTTAYEYKNGPTLEVLAKTVDGNGVIEDSVEEKYNEDGTLIEKTESEFENGNVIKTKKTTYNETGKEVSVVTRTYDKDGEPDRTEKEEYSYYDSGIRKNKLIQYFDKNGLMSGWDEYKYNAYGVRISYTRHANNLVVNAVVYDETERKLVEMDDTEVYFDETGRIIRRKSEVFREIIEEEFFYSDKTGKTAVIKTEKRTNDEGKIQISKNTYDSEGRILQSVTKNDEGEETRAEYNWNYQGDGIRAKDVLQKTVYSDDKLKEETLYLITPLASEEQQEWYWSYGDFSYCTHHYHNDESVTTKNLESFFTDYVSPVGQYHLERYFRMLPDEEIETWKTYEEADFDSAGRLKTFRSIGAVLVTWEFDDRENVIRVESKDSDGETNQIYEYEYTYYTASSETGGQ